MTTAPLPSAAPPATTAAGGAPIRVLLVDDHALFREGLRQLLAPEGDIAIVGEAADAAAARRLARELRPDVVLLDINLPDGDGVAAAETILAERPETAVVMLTMYRPEEHADRAVRAGARGYLLKTAGAGDVARAVRLTSRGAAMVDPTLVPSLLREFRRLLAGPAAPPVAPLGATERALLALLVEGRSNKELARALRMAESTVKNRLTGLFQRLGARDRTQAAVRALALGLVPERGAAGAAR